MTQQGMRKKLGKLEKHELVTGFDTWKYSLLWV